MSGYWPWWLGAAALATATVSHLALTRHPLGVSGAWGRALFWREERAAERVDAELARTLGEEELVSPQAPVSSTVVLLVAMMVGSLIAGLIRGGWQLHTDMGPAFAGLFGRGTAMWIVLFLGGILVGFGTRMAGGCSSGHGLSGCGRLAPASFVATASFFGTAVVVSLLLPKVL